MTRYYQHNRNLDLIEEVTRRLRAVLIYAFSMRVGSAKCKGTIRS